MKESFTCELISESYTEIEPVTISYISPPTQQKPAKTFFHCYTYFIIYQTMWWKCENNNLIYDVFIKYVNVVILYMPQVFN